MKKIFIYVEACELGLLDGTKLYYYFLKNGYQIVYEPEEADIIFYIACSWCNITADHILTSIKEDFQEKYDAELIVAGCLPAIKKEQLAKFFNGKTIITKDLDKIDDLFPDNKIKFSEIEDVNLPLEKIYASREFYRNKYVENIKDKVRKIKFFENLYIKTYVRLKKHTYKKLFDYVPILSRFYTFEPFFMIRISRGCLYKHPCSSYLDIKNAAGSLKSKPLEECIKEFKKGLDAGYKDIVITADETGAYGLDIGSSFPELLKKMVEIPGDYKIHIENLCPRWLVKYIDDLEELTKTQKIKHLTILIESVNSRLLKLMGRYDDAEKIKNAFLRMKKKSLNLSLLTHFVVGFPSETWEEFKETLGFIKEIGFDSGYIYRVSYESNIDIGDPELKISDEEISRRFKYAENFLKKEGYRLEHSPCFLGLTFNKKK